MCRIITKQTMGMTLNLQNSQLMTFSLSTEEILPGTRPKTACGKSSNCRFSLSAARNATGTKATEDVTSGFSFRILVFFTF